MSVEANIAAFLPRAAEERPDAPAIYCPTGKGGAGKSAYHHYTYAQLNAESDAIARGMRAIGIGRGARTALMVRPGLDLFALTFGLFKAGAVPVFIDPGIGVSRMGRCLAESEPEAFVGIPQAHRARLLLGWGRASIRTTVTVGGFRLWGGYSLNRVKALGGDGKGDTGLEETRPEDDAAILFTSGSTGAPKGVVYQHRHFSAQVELIRGAYGIEPGEVDLPTFPLFALFDPALGMITVIPDMDPTRPAQVDPRKLTTAIEEFGVTNMFGSPALLNTLGRYGEGRKIHLSSLKRVISAGAPVPAEVMERVLAMLPEDARVVTPYGATECLPVSSISSHEVLGETRSMTGRGAGVCVGRPVAPNEVTVIEISDEVIETWDDVEPVADGTIGEIVVRGPTTTQRYYNRDEATRLAKITHPGEERVSHRMGDVGYLDDEGRLWFCGRKAHRVVTPTETLFTVPCEMVFNTHPRVFRTALVGVEVAGRITPVLCVETEEGGAADWKTLEAELRDLALEHVHSRAVQRFLRHPGFPVDIRHNAKIGREELQVWAGARVR